MYETGRATNADPQHVHNRGDLVTFLDQVLADFRDRGEREWENGTLDRFLDGLAAYAADTSGAAGDPPTWQAFAGLIRAATGYE